MTLMQRRSECEVIAGPSSQDVIDLTELSDGSEWVIDLTATKDPCSSSKGKGKSKAQPMDVIDLT